MKQLIIVVYFLAVILIERSLNSDPNKECTDDLDCGTEGAVCKNSACTCPSDFVVNSDRTRCLLESLGYGENCEDNAQCSSVLKAGGQCHDGKCRCAKSFHYHLGQCFRSSGLGEPCRANTNCFSNYDFDSTSCGTNKKCQCSEGYYLREYSSCRKASYAPGDPCGISQDCHFANAVCTMSRVCAYSNTTLPTPWPSLELSSYRTEELKTYDNCTNPSEFTVGLECHSSEDCGAFSYCSSGGRCLCQSGYYVSDKENACYPEIGAACTKTDQCKGRNTMCDNGICRCKPGFVAMSDNRLCLKLSRNIGWSCLHDVQCSLLGEGGYCANKKCTCRAGTHFEKQHLYCWKTLDVGETCFREEDCRSEGKTCFEGKCSCIDNYHSAENNSVCRKNSLHPGDKCIDDSDCVFEYSTCISNTCQCIGGYFPSDNNKCITGIGGTCEKGSACYANNSICVEGYCVCPEHYVRNEGGSNCHEVSKSYKSSCIIHPQCTESFGPLAACVEGECVCSENSHFYKEERGYEDMGQCYEDRLLGENCTMAAQCIEDYGNEFEKVECRRGFCQCRYEYTYDAIYKTCSGASCTWPSVLLVIALGIKTIYNGIF